MMFVHIATLFCILIAVYSSPVQPNQPYQKPQQPFVLNPYSAVKPLIYTSPLIYPGTQQFGTYLQNGGSATPLTPQNFAFPTGSFYPLEQHPYMPWPFIKPVQPLDDPNLVQLWQRNIGGMTVVQKEPEAPTMVDVNSPSKPIEGCTHKISLQTTTARSYPTATASPSLEMHPTVSSSQSPPKVSSIPPQQKMTVTEISTTTIPTVQLSTMSNPAARLPSHINATSEVKTISSSTPSFA